MAQALAEIFGNAETEETVISANTLTLAQQWNNKLRLEVAKVEETFNNKTNKVVSHSMAYKICERGLNYYLLKPAFERNRENGIKLLLSETRQAGIRVTNKSRIIKSINNFFAKQSN